MDDLEEKLRTLSDTYLCTSHESAARDAVHLLLQLRHLAISTILIYPQLTSSPEQFEILVEKAIENLQRNPPEPHSIFCRDISVRDVRVSILGPSEGGYKPSRAIADRNIFFIIFAKAYALEKEDLLEACNRGAAESHATRFAILNPQEGKFFPLINHTGTYKEYLAELRHQKRKHELEKERLAWLRDRQAKMKDPSGGGR